MWGEWQINVLHSIVIFVYVNKLSLCGKLLNGRDKLYEL
jgi:hypothetical protein